MDNSNYRAWREARLDNHPHHAQELRVEIGGLVNLNKMEKVAILAVCRRSNMAIYRCRDDFSDRAAVRAFAANFGLLHLDHHLCTHEDGVSEISVASTGVRSEYVPYSNNSLSWHTDGYYNDPSRQIHALVLHCANDAVSGGENFLFDPEIAYIRLRDENPAFITAFEHPACMTIPANKNPDPADSQDKIRPAVCGPVFSGDPQSGTLHMRYSARKKNIQWRDDKTTTAARDFLTELLDDDAGPLFRYRLQAGEGLICNNVLHKRTAFEDTARHQRLLYRARFYDRMISN